ncbi:unnamed protein product [Cuscuta campestris]|uniref:Uncharacterized protein n=1 Tax=Cuscuta campestris TaxID=132261 RepID=A0A484N8K7_9ASTE|nr:unnamed protein product [Cuscuta campestris]
MADPNKWTVCPSLFRKIRGRVGLVQAAVIVLTNQKSGGSEREGRRRFRRTFRRRERIDRRPERRESARVSGARRRVSRRESPSLTTISGEGTQAHSPRSTAATRLCTCRISI